MYIYNIRPEKGDRHEVWGGASERRRKIEKEVKIKRKLYWNLGIETSKCVCNDDDDVFILLFFYFLYYYPLITCNHSRNFTYWNFTDQRRKR